MAAAIAAHDWRATPLGPIEAWTALLRSTVALMLRSPVAMAVLWGEDGHMVYNAGYARIAGARHPTMLGRPAREAWPETADFGAEVLRVGLAGGTRSYRDRAFTLHRHGRVETVRFNLDCSPLLDEAGRPSAVLAIIADSTAGAEAERHRRAMEQTLRVRDEQLEVSIESLQLATDAAEIGIWDFDPLRDQLTWTDRTRAMFGIAPGVPCTIQDFYDALHPDDFAATAAAFAAALDPARREPYDVEYRAIGRDDGRLRTVAAKGKGLFDDAGRCVRAIGTAIDVTERRRIESRRLALIQLGERIRDLDDPAELGYAAAELLGRTLGVSRAGYGTIDKRAETITIERDWNAPGITTIAGILHFRDYGSYIDDLNAGRTVVCADARLDPRTAGTADALEAISARSFVNMPVTEAGGLVALLYLNHAEAREWSEDELALVREFAERTRAAAARREAERELRALNSSLEREIEARTAELQRVWQHSRDLSVVLGLDGVLIAVNPAWTALLGYEPREMIGRSFLDFLWPDDVEASGEALAAAAGSALPDDFENRYRHRDGTLRRISWRTATEGDRIYAYGRDVTAERVQAEALAAAQHALRQAQKMEAVGQLTGGIAHDFNNMLAVIAGSLDLLRRRFGKTEPNALRYVESAADAARRATLLTQRLLAFSRQQPLKPEPLDVNALVHGMSELLQRSLGSSVRLETDLAGGLWRTLADPNQLENALLNLAVNARDAMPDGGRLTIQTGNLAQSEAAARRHAGARAGDYVQILVTDNGTGMTADVAAKAFDPFFTTKEVGKGTGLGLSQVYGFVKQTGGHVRIASTPGSGTTIQVHLPRLTEPAGTAGPAPRPDASSEDTRARVGDDGAAATPDGREPAAVVHDPSQAPCVLVVEDQAEVRQFSVEAMRLLGYRVLEAAGGAEALRLLEAHPDIALLFTDVVMPDMNGARLAEEARRRRPGLRVLYTTGYARSAVMRDGVLDAGVQLIGKPFTIEELATRTRDVLGS